MGADARLMFDRFATAGGTFIDTADCYQAGESERVLGDLLAADRDHFVLSTKFTLGTSPEPQIWHTGNSRKTMVRALEASLRRLKTDYVDLFWAHFCDEVTPIDEIVAAFDDLVRAGKILYSGLSNFAAWRVSRAVTMTEIRGWSPVVGVQSDYSLVARTAERELLPMAESLGLGAALWSPLGGGLLTGRYRRSREGWVGGRRVITTGNTDQNEEIVATLGDVARESGASPSQVAMAWVRGKAARLGTAAVPIIGPRTPEQLTEYLDALDLVLTSDQLSRLNRASAVPLGTPHEVSMAVRDDALGGDASRLARPAVPVA